MAVTRPVDPRLRCGRDGQNLLSLDGPAHVFHRALVNEIVNGSHARLGDAVLAAQQAYAFSGHMPELLGVCNLLGDPELSVRP